MKKILLGAAASLLFVAGIASAQTYNPPTVSTVGPTDLFQDIQNGVPLGQSIYATAAQINGPQGMVLTTPLTGFSLSFVNGQTYSYITPAGTLATGTFTFAATPGQGQRNCIRSTQTQTAVTLAVASGSGQTINTPVTAMTAATTYCWIYNQATATWYPI